MSCVTASLLAASYFVNGGLFIVWSLPWVVVVFAFMVAASRALVLRGAITARLRKSQALGIGLTAAAIACFSTVFIQPPLPGGSTAPGAGLISGLYFLAFFLLPWPLFFYWVDSSVLNAIRSDPLSRDILHWRRTRKWVWGFLESMIGLYFVLAIVLVGIVGPLPTSLDNLNAIPIFAIIGLPFVTGLVLLPIAARRSSDPTIKRHLRWFGGFVGFLGLGVVGLFLEDITGVLFPAWQILWAVAGYSLYRSASSLVVVSKVPTSNDLTTEHSTSEV